MMATRYRVMVVEDEALARQRLARLVDEREQFELAAVCRNASEALAALERDAIDIVLLDIEMPGTNGMELLRRLHTKPDTPLAILTTAHAQFAVDAFAEQAVDYLLKPFDGARLDAALAAAVERLRAREAIAANERIRKAIGVPAQDVSADAGTVDPHSNCLLVRETGRMRVLRAGEIDWIEAAGRDCIAHCGRNAYRIDGPLAKLASQLEVHRFLAASRSALINGEHVTELHEMFKGALVAVLHNGIKVPVSRRFRRALLARFGNG